MGDCQNYSSKSKWIGGECQSLIQPRSQGLSYYRPLELASRSGKKRNPGNEVEPCVPHGMERDTRIGR